VSSSRSPLRIGLVAGETSGDTLGAALIQALRERVPDVQVFGMAGPKMVAAGCDAWVSSDQLGVMGLFEVLAHLPRLLSLRRSLIDRFSRVRPDVVVGIDVPDFNLGLEKQLKRRGLRTVQYVSPQVWAWRQGRVRTIGQSCDLVLCLLPFETEFYAQHGVRAEFVGHPLADQIPLDVDREAARRALGIDPAATVVALLPGSRMGEVQRLGTDFLAAASWIAARQPGVKFLTPLASHRTRVAFEKQLAEARGFFVRGANARTDVSSLAIDVLDGQAQCALAAADGVIVASGTATLETLLSGRPMVVAYRLGALTAFLLKRFGLVKVPYFSQPNLLLGRRRVPEFFQDEVTGEALGEALLAEMRDSGQVAVLQSEFRRVHEVLRRGGAARAADAILEYVGRAGANEIAPVIDAMGVDAPRFGAESARSKPASEPNSSSPAKASPDAKSASEPPSSPAAGPDSKSASEPNPSSPAASPDSKSASLEAPSRGASASDEAPGDVPRQ
jgi:lipid-A-disaccharide synthase